MSTATTTCPFCEVPTRFNIRDLNLHLIMSHHLEKTSYLCVDIQFTDGSRARRYLLNETPTCPIGKCSAGPLTFDNNGLGAHLRKKHKMTEDFKKKLDSGYYFWWNLRHDSKVSKEESRSMAFSNPELRAAALQRLSETPDPALDPYDQAIQDAEAENNNDDFMEYDIPLDLPPIGDDGQISDTVNPNGVPSNSQTLAQSSNTQMSPSQQFEESNPTDQLILPASTMQNMANLSCPTSLSRHSIGIIRLPDFPGTPIVPVCLMCRSVINTTSHDVVRRHTRRCIARSHTIPNAFIPPDEPDPELPINQVQLNLRAGSLEHDSDNDSTVSDSIDPDDPQSIPAPDIAGAVDMTALKSSVRQEWKEAKLYFDNANNIKKVTASIPLTVIAAISFFPVHDGYRCPYPPCPRAFKDESAACGHYKQHPEQNCDAGDQFFNPEAVPCSMQTLAHTASPHTFFCVEKVPPSDNEGLPPISIQSFIKNALKNTAKGPTGSLLEGLPHISPFFKRFSYPSIFPADSKDHASFAKSRITQLSTSYNTKQTPEHQLLALTALTYHLINSRLLGAGDDLTRRQLGSKLLSHQLTNQGRNNPFKPLQQKKSLVRYATFHASLIAYVVDINNNPDADSELTLCVEHKANATALKQALANALQSQPLISALANVRNLHQESAYERNQSAFTNKEMQEIVLPACITLHQAFHGLAFSLVKFPKHLKPGQSTFSTPIHRFLALRSLNMANGRFFDLVPLHNTMAHLQWALRMTVYAQHRVECELEPEIAPYTHLCRIKDECACQDATTPFGILQDQLRYAGMLATQLTVTPDAMWDPATQSAWLNGIQVSRAGFMNMLQTELAEVTNLLDNELLFQRREKIFDHEVDGIPTFIRPAYIRELPRATANGYSYLMDNPAFWNYSNRLVSLVETEEDLHHRFLHPFLVEQELTWNHLGIQQWVNTVDDWKCRLACLVYWLSGMPPRGVEFTSTLIFNSQDVPRNIFCSQRDLVIQHNYTKTKLSSGFGMPTIRMPAHPLQRLLEEYMVVVKPLYDRFMRILKGPAANTSDGYHCLLWTINGQQMTTDILSEALRRISSRHFGHQIGIRSWRQLMIQFGDNILPASIRSLPLTTTALTAQASHGCSAENSSYNRQVDTTFAQVNSAQFTEFRCVSVAWAEALGFPHPHLQSGQVFPGAEATVLQESQYLVSEISSRINVHTSAMIDDKIINALAQVRMIQPINTPHSPRLIPLDVPVSSLAHRLLKQLFPGIEGFCSLEQSMCVQYTPERAPDPLIVVHPMGHGKSAVYLVPMLNEKGSFITIVIVPLLALAQAAALTATNLGFKAQFFNPRSNAPQGKADFLALDLVVMTYDLLVANVQVQRWLKELADSRLLARIVVDEAHTIGSEDHFRARFPEVYANITRIAVPKVFLSGTMPDNICQKIIDGFQDFRSLYISRLPSDRPNLSYRVDNLLASTKNIKAFCQRVTMELIPYLEDNPTDSAIIFTRNVQWANDIADALKCALFTGPADLEEKQAHLARWLNPESTSTSMRILVGTSSISLGLDKHRVPHIWMYGDPHDAITFAQMSARGGRDGNPAIVRLFPSATRPEKEDAALKAFKATSGCRRTPIARFLDNRSITCHALPAPVALCDNCLNQDPSNATSAALIDISGYLAPKLTLEERERNLRSTIVALYHAIKMLTSACCFCVLSNAPNANHDASTCPSNLYARLPEFKVALAKTQSRRGIPGLAVCSKCNMPQKAGHDHGMDHHTKYINSATNECGLQNHYVSIVIALLNSPLHRRKVLAQTPGLHPAEVLDSLLNPVTCYPCATRDTGRQLLAFHFLLIAAVGESPYADGSLRQIAAEPWFSRWSLKSDTTSDSSGLLSQIDTSGLHPTNLSIPLLSHTSTVSSVAVNPPRPVGEAANILPPTYKVPQVMFFK